MKHLYDSLRVCAKEEEVKAEFCKFFKMNLHVAAMVISMAVVAASAAPLPSPEFVDAGACTNVALSALSSSGVLSFSLSSAPGPSNNVEVAFGADLDGDGKLSPDERRMEV